MTAKTRSVDVEKIKKAIIAFGKKKGHVTLAELRELLPSDVVDHQKIGEWRKLLEDEGVTIVEAEARPATSSSAAAPAAAAAPKRERDEDEDGPIIARHDDDEELEDDDGRGRGKARRSREREGEAGGEGPTRTNDPVRMYLVE